MDRERAPKSPEELLANLLYLLEADRRELDEQARALKSKSKLGRALALRRNPRLAEHIEYRDAPQSIVDARQSAYANEGNIVIF
jgi:hypothetical protein